MFRSHLHLTAGLLAVTSATALAQRPPDAIPRAVVQQSFANWATPAAGPFPERPPVPASLELARSIAQQGGAFELSWLTSDEIDSVEQRFAADYRYIHPGPMRMGLVRQ